MLRLGDPDGHATAVLRLAGRAFQVPEVAAGAMARRLVRRQLRRLKTSPNPP